MQSLARASGSDELTWGRQRMDSVGCCRLPQRANRDVGGFAAQGKIASLNSLLNSFSERCLFCPEIVRGVTQHGFNGRERAERREARRVEPTRKIKDKENES